MSRRPTVILADDHKLVARGLAEILGQRCDVVAIAEDGRQLVELVRELRPDLVVTDLSMPSLGGLDAMRELRVEPTPPKFIALTAYPDAQMAAEAVRAGAIGYVLKQSSADELLTAVEHALRGRVYLTPLLAGEIVRAVAEPKTSPADQLTLRQREILRLILDGRTVKEAADVLGLSTRTIETHKYQMMHKLGVRTTVELVEYAFKNGLADAPPPAFMPPPPPGSTAVGHTAPIPASP
jgi:DNA-binding NarL/FixJ family response regulator